MSAQAYEEEKKKEAEETNSVCSYCSNNSPAPISAIPRAFFGKARTKNKVHKLPGDKSDQ